MRTQNPETMTPAERDAEVASILALVLARAIHAERSRSTREPSDLAKSDADRLELLTCSDGSYQSLSRFNEKGAPFLTASALVGCKRLAMVSNPWHT